MNTEYTATDTVIVILFVKPTLPRIIFNSTTVSNSNLNLQNGLSVVYFEELNT